MLASNDVGLRTGEPEVHQARVAARRLRSTLRIFGDVVDAAPGEELNIELAWYADLRVTCGTVTFSAAASPS